MKAAHFTRYGPPQAVTITDLPIPTPKPGEVLIRVAVASVTAADWRVRSANPFLVRLFFGLFKPKRQVLGSEFAGVIEAVGEGVKTWKPGMRVSGATDLSFGANAEYLVHKEDGTMVEIPEGVSMETAAVLAFGGLTALHFLRDFSKLTAGERMLIIGSSGSVGGAAVQLAKHYGAHVTAMARGSRRDAVMAMGADAFIDYTATDIHAISERFDLIFDAAGKVSFPRCRRLLNKTGRYITAGMHLSLPLHNLWSRLRGSRQRGQSGYSDHVNKADDLGFLMKLVTEGHFEPYIEKRFPLEDIQEAHAYAETEHKVGNLPVIVSAEL